MLIGCLLFPLAPRIFINFSLKRLTNNQIRLFSRCHKVITFIHTRKMSQSNLGTGYPTVEGLLPIKRKRGRPRKNEYLGVPSGSVPAKKSHPRGISQKDCATGSLVGKTVHGVLDGSFDAGYFLTVRAGNTGPVMRGVVFDPRFCVPITPLNDVAPHVKMVKRTECSFPFASSKPTSLPVFQQHLDKAPTTNEVGLPIEGSPSVLNSNVNYSEIGRSIKGNGDQVNQNLPVGSVPLRTGYEIPSLHLPSPSVETKHDQVVPEPQTKFANVIPPKYQNAITAEGRTLMLMQSSTSSEDQVNVVKSIPQVQNDSEAKNESHAVRGMPTATNASSVHTKCYLPDEKAKTLDTYTEQCSKLTPYVIQGDAPCQSGKVSDDGKAQMETLSDNPALQAHVQPDANKIMQGASVSKEQEFSNDQRVGFVRESMLSTATGEGVSYSRIQDSDVASCSLGGLASVKSGSIHERSQPSASRPLSALISQADVCSQPKGQPDNTSQLPAQLIWSDHGKFHEGVQSANMNERTVEKGNAGSSKNVYQNNDRTMDPSSSSSPGAFDNVNLPLMH